MKRKDILSKLNALADSKSKKGMAGHGIETKYALGVSIPNIRAIAKESGKNDFIEFDSMINMRPSQGNMSRGVDDKEIRQGIIEVVNKWVRR